MTSSRDLKDVLDRYFEDGPTELPVRSFDEVRTSIDHIQQRVVIGPWRKPAVPNLFRLAVLGVVVFALSLAGAYLAPRQSAIVGSSPSPSPTVEPALLPGQDDPSYSA